MSTERVFFVYNYSIKIKEIRKEKGISQNKLAKSLNTKQQVISRYEREESSPSLERLVEIAQILGVSLDELVEFKKIHADYSLELKEKIK